MGKSAEQLQKDLAVAKARAELAETKLRSKVLAARSRAVDNVMARVRDQRRREAMRRRGTGSAGGGFGGPAAPQARYDNATRTRLRVNARALGGSAQSHLLRAQRLLRLDCQDGARNSPAMRAIIKTWQDSRVGDGGVVTSTSSSEGFNDLTDLWFNAWCEGCSEELGYPDVRRRHGYWGNLRLVVKAWGTDGDILYERLPNGQVRLIEGELVVNPSGAPGSIDVKETGGQIIDGVEVDKFGRVVGYHVGAWGPYLGSVLPGKRFIDAQNAVLLINPSDDTVGMVRGEPGLQAVVDKVERLDLWLQNTDLAAEIATYFGLAIKTEKPGQTQRALQDATDDQPDNSNPNAPLEAELQQLGVIHLKPGESVEQIKPEYPTINHGEYLLKRLMIICADAGVPVCQAFLDATGMSWSNIKALLAMSARRTEFDQDYLVANCVKPDRAMCVRRWMAEGRYKDAGVAVPIDWQSCHVVMPDVPVIDEKSAAEAGAILTGQNLRTKDQQCQKIGSGRFKDVVKARGKERKLEIEADVVPAALPGAKSDGGGSGTSDAGAEGAGQKEAA